MSTLKSAAGPWVALVAVAFGLVACKPKVSSSQCDSLIARYAQMVVTEKFADASADQIRLEQERERSEARGDDVFKNCSSEVSQTEFECAMHSATTDAFEKCLE